ncbi:hypothetical protein H5410_054074 [Solanum commersonii]|uniref:Uncharacterized protein n=1 Tax=Solanum commersonii TaxID=4109 RepID=A0A9J5X6S6_SOLCO|nr:hypothetical protein H5410_054074 [Solanum commersonii]
MTELSSFGVPTAVSSSSSMVPSKEISELSASVADLTKAFARQQKLLLDLMSQFSLMIICSTSSSSHTILGSPCKYAIGFIGIGLAIRAGGHKTAAYCLLCSGSLSVAACPIPKRGCPGELVVIATRK